MHHKTLPPWIAYDQKLRNSQDYFFLRREGIRLVQELSGKIWTDYNDHDPGVTILEQCCYALTDMAYRTGIDIERLLFRKGEVADTAAANSLYMPEEVLLATQVTLLDHKRLFLDQLEGVANVWMRPSAQATWKGLYDIVVLPLADDPSLGQLKQKVRRFYTAHRNLCEDVSQIVILKPEPIEISADIDLYEETPVEDTLAEIYHQLDAYFNHKITYTSFEALQKQGMDLLEIFEMPSFDKNKGFLNSLCLEEYKSSYSMSKIQNLFGAIKGIRSVRNVIVRKNGIQVTSEQIDVEEGCFAALSTLWNQATIRVLKNNLKIDYKIDKVQALYKHRVAEDAKYFTYNGAHKVTVQSSEKEHLGQYSSVQNTFPVLYGIGNYGLPSEASTQRVQYARQLQGYLLFFDQLLVNHLAHLEHIPQLFSYDPTEATTQVAYPTNVPNVDDLVDESLKDALHGLMDDNFPQRKNRLLDHLMARFGERFVDASYDNLHNIYGLNTADDILPRMVELKSSYLRQLKDLHQYKNKAYDYALPYWNGKALSGSSSEKLANEIIRPDVAFKKKVFLSLNLPEENEGNVSLLPDYSLLRVKDVDRGIEGATTSVGASSATSVTFILPQSVAVLDQLIYYGGHKRYYDISNKPDAQGLYKLSFRHMGSSSSIPLGAYTSEDEAAVVVDKLLKKFKTMGSKSEGFHVLEHILLRPIFQETFMLYVEIESGLTLVSVHKDIYEQQKSLLFDVMIYGTKANNYEVRQETIGASVKYYVYLKDEKGNDLMRLKARPALSTKLIAQSYIEDKLVPFVKSISKGKFVIPASAHIKDMRPQGNARFEEQRSPVFFNDRMSLILPNWLPRFNEPDFRVLLRASLGQHLPAHIHAKEVWLDKADMATFERLHQKWMALKAEVVGMEATDAVASTGQRASQRKEHYLMVAKTRLMDAYAQQIVTRFLKNQENVG